MSLGKNAHASHPHGQAGGFRRLLQAQRRSAFPAHAQGRRPEDGGGFSQVPWSGRGKTGDGGYRRSSGGVLIVGLNELIGLLGILIGLGLLIWLAFKGWSVLLLAPIAALAAGAISREPLLAHWTQTFMRSAA